MASRAYWTVECVYTDGADDMDPEHLTGEYAGPGGDRFAALVSKYARPMLAVAYRYTFDWESAKDVC